MDGEINPDKLFADNSDSPRKPRVRRQAGSSPAEKPRVRVTAGSSPAAAPAPAAPAAPAPAPRATMPSGSQFFTPQATPSPGSRAAVRGAGLLPAAVMAGQALTSAEDPAIRERARQEGSRNLGRRGAATGYYGEPRRGAAGAVFQGDQPDAEVRPGAPGPVFPGEQPPHEGRPGAAGPVFSGEQTPQGDRVQRGGFPGEQPDHQAPARPPIMTISPPAQGGGAGIDGGGHYPAPIRDIEDTHSDGSAPPAAAPLVRDIEDTRSDPSEPPLPRPPAQPAAQVRRPVRGAVRPGARADDLNAMSLSAARGNVAGGGPDQRDANIRARMAQLAAAGAKAGGKVEKYAKGGRVGGKCHGDGLAKRGRTKGRFI